MQTPEHLDNATVGTNSLRVPLFVSTKLFLDVLNETMETRGINTIPGLEWYTRHPGEKTAHAPVNVCCYEMNRTGAMSALDELASMRSKSSFRLLALIDDVDPEGWQTIMAAKAGALGMFDINTEGPDKIITAIDSIGSGTPYYSDSVLNALMTHIRNYPECLLAESSDISTSTLTAREMQVLKTIGEGLTNKQIARKLGIVVSTVKTHVQVVLKKCGFRNRMEAHFYSRATLP